MQLFWRNWTFYFFLFGPSVGPSCHITFLALYFVLDQLKEIGVVDEVIWEPAQGETHEHFPIMAG